MEENIYVDVKDLEQLGYKIDKNKQPDESWDSVTK